MFGLGEGERKEKRIREGKPFSLFGKMREEKIGLIWSD